MEETLIWGKSKCTPLWRRAPLVNFPDVQQLISWCIAPSDKISSWGIMKVFFHDHIIAKVFRYLKSRVYFSVIISLCLYFVQFWNKDNFVLHCVVVCNFVSFSRDLSVLVLSEKRKKNNPDTLKRMCLTGWESIINLI